MVSSHSTARSSMCRKRTQTPIMCVSESAPSLCVFPAGPGELAHTHAVGKLRTRAHAGGVELARPGRTRTRPPRAHDAVQHIYQSRSLKSHRDTDTHSAQARTLTMHPNYMQQQGRGPVVARTAARAARDPKTREILAATSQVPACDEGGGRLRALQGPRDRNPHRDRPKVRACVRVVDFVARCTRDACLDACGVLSCRHGPSALRPALRAPKSKAKHGREREALHAQCRGCYLCATYEDYGNYGS